MPEAALIGAALNVWKEAGVAGLVVLFGIMALSAFKGDGRKTPPPAPRDDKHDANQGMIRETQQIAVSGFSEVARRFDSLEDRLERMHVLGEIIKDRMER